jgi:glycosyltransferase involved in cell wall biosynthesis
MIRQVLDITRTISRIGRGFPTGIDRVERAYIKEFLERFPDAVYLAKLTHTYVVLDTAVIHQFVDAKFGETLKCPLGANDAFRFKLPRSQRKARSFLRHNAKLTFQVGHTLESLAQLSPAGFHYTNVGHSNLGAKFLSQLKPSGCHKIRVMIHDMIPLDFPEYCRDNIPENFRANMQSVARVVDDVICNSEYTKSRVKKYFANWPNSASFIVAYLGIDKVFYPTQNIKSHPTCFVILGTIEPRKNHMLLLNVWSEFSKSMSKNEMPELHIVGKRGWENDVFFKRLDTSPLLHTKIIEHGSMNDADLNALLCRSSGLLFPSFVEGYGLPAVEALAVGVPVICSDIPVFKELLGTNACILPCDNLAAWTKQLLEISRQDPISLKIDVKKEQNTKFNNWPAHFRHVFER